MNMKHIILLLALLFAGQAWGQVPEEIPDTYERTYKRTERRIEKEIRKESPDVILDPIESVPITPSFYALETGNWGPTYLGVNQRAEEIRSRAKRNVVVFIFDTAGEYDHPYLKDYAWNDLGRVFTGESSGKDGHGHSTHCAGIVCANAPDFPLGIARMIPIKVVPVKVLSNGGSGSFTGITNGTKYANVEAKKLIDKGWFVIYSYSLGGGSSYQPLEDAFNEAEALGVLINVAANGNTGKSPVNYPGSSRYTLGTAALAQSGGGVTRARYSSYGPETWGAAPGSSILSTWPGGGTAILSGTSMATPHLAGLFAILASVYPDATADELKAHYIKYATDLGSPGRDEYYGYGAGVIGPLLDNAPGGKPVPDPPTCTDGKQNGKETGVDCGGPDCPACEPVPDPEPVKPPYKKRTFEVAMDGPYVLRWVIAGGGKETGKVEVAPDGSIRSGGAVFHNLDNYGTFQAAAATNITITRFVVEVSSESTYKWEYDALVSNAAKFFRNSSLGTPSDWDVYHAGQYCLYFLDYYIANSFSGFVPQNIKPVSVEFEWEGVKVLIAKDLFDYPGKVK